MPATDSSRCIEPGQLVAVVGPSGAGKTTLTSLVPRFQDPGSGAVSIDGHDLRKLTFESLRGAIGIVFQTRSCSTPRCATTCCTRDRTPAGRSSRQPRAPPLYASHRGRQLAARRLRHHRRCARALPQRRREAARGARARDPSRTPRIPILDEAASNLDSVTEQLIEAALAPLFAGRTSLVIAHRLSTILAAGTIVVLDDGRLVDQGTHAILPRRGGLYPTLYARQFRTELLTECPADEVRKLWAP